ncbi:MAG: CDP-diacylglycerol--serine O-phosphatidyltransferase [Syntrophomonadaceae bacterium]|nr:CDP-diacylglycerol--serine O-phosphatidyltransferase [Syntrophomonadaceae bacterium]
MGYIPNAFTLVNLSFGVLALLGIIHGEFTAAAIFILVAACLDRMDGRVARHLNVESELGKQLDSLADLVSFGVAPAVLVYTQVLDPSCAQLVSAGVTVIFILCGAFRLARFNVLNIGTYFVGVPITLAGGLVGLFSLLSIYLPAPFYLISLPMLSYLMVSNIKIPKL